MSKKVFILAGEASSDKIGAKLMLDLKKQAQNKIKFYGVGGDLMKAQGLLSLEGSLNFGIIGFKDIVLKFFSLYFLVKKICNYAKEVQPDIVVTIDAWDFCSRVVKCLRKNLKNTKFVHYVLPSVWIYRQKRAYEAAKLYDLLLSIFPFEEKFFKNAVLKEKNSKFLFVGHPLVEEFEYVKKDSSFRSKNKINANTKIIGVTVGSREAEIIRLLPIFAQAIKKFLIEHRDQKFCVIFPVLNSCSEQLIKSYNLEFDHKIINIAQIGGENKIKMFKSFDLALAKSGTNTLELALCKVLMIVAYKVDWFSMFIAKNLFKLHKKTKYICIVNILLQKNAVQEYVQQNCNSSALAEGLSNLINKDVGKKLLLNYDKVVKMLTDKNSLDQAAKSIIQLFEN